MEWILQALWNERYLMERDNLRTVSGKSVEIIHPGNWNVEAGPDFIDAVLRIDNELCRGDIEIHHTPEDWHRHGHTASNGYENVILHVVWKDQQNKPSANLPPCLVMKEHLQPVWLRLVEEFTERGYPYSRKIAPGRCALQTARLENKAIRDFLTGAGLARFREKSRVLLERSLSVGFEQTAYEVFFEALGYKSNRTGFLNLTKLLPLERLREIKPFLSRLAALLGTAGFLTDPTRRPIAADKELRAFNRELWDRWWRLGIESTDIPWCKHGIRPANRPERRLQAGCMILEKWDYSPLLAWSRELKTSASPRETIRNLPLLFATVPNHEFTKVTELTGGENVKLGRKRILDITANLILPLLHAKARHDNDQARGVWTEAVFAALPRLQDNRTLREISHRLLVPASREREVAPGAVHQQGLLAVSRNFCQENDCNCTICPLSRQTVFEKALGHN